MVLELADNINDIVKCGYAEWVPKTWPDVFTIICHFNMHELH